MKKIIAIAALSAALTTPAFAAGNNAYVFGDLGAGSYANATDGQNAFKNPSKFGFGAGYNFTQNVAAEVGYHIFGDSSNQYGNGTNTLKASSLTIAAVGTLPINAQFSAVGKLGLAANKMDSSTTVFGFTGKSFSQNSLYYAIGGQYNIDRQVSIRLQYENFGKMTGTLTNNVTASAFGVGLLYNF